MNVSGDQNYSIILHPATLIDRRILKLLLLNHTFKTKSPAPQNIIHLQSGVFLLFILNLQIIPIGQLSGGRFGY